MRSAKPEKGRWTPTGAWTWYGAAQGRLKGQVKADGTVLAPHRRCRQKSRASVLVAWSHETPTAQQNRNQRSSANEYDRCVVAGRPVACKSRKYSDTGPIRTPVGSLSQYGSQGSPVSTSAPAAGTTSDLRSRNVPSSSPSAMTSDRNDRHRGMSGESSPGLS